jgi:hypothetical protein
LNKKINGVDTHFLTSFSYPPFPWTHNNNQWHYIVNLWMWTRAREHDQKLVSMSMRKYC